MSILYIDTVSDGMYWLLQGHPKVAYQPSAKPYIDGL